MTSLQIRIRSKLRQQGRLLRQLLEQLLGRRNLAPVPVPIDRPRIRSRRGQS